MCYYARLNNGDKTEVLWSHTLDRAIELAKVRSGEWVEFIKIGFREGVG